MSDEQSAKSEFNSPAGESVAQVEQGQSRLLREEVEAKPAEAVDEPSSAMTREDWDEIRREGRRIIEQRKKN